MTWADENVVDGAPADMRYLVSGCGRGQDSADSTVPPDWVATAYRLRATGDGLKVVPTAAPYVRVGTYHFVLR